MTTHHASQARPGTRRLQRLQRWQWLADADGTGLLRLALRLDAVASGALGVLLVAAGPVLDGPLGLPLRLLWPLGLFLVGYAAAVWFVATRPRVSRPAAWTVVGLNLFWVAGSVVDVVAGWFTPTGLGIAFVLAQAAAVAVLADLQFLGLRQARPTA